MEGDAANARSGAPPSMRQGRWLLLTAAVLLVALFASRLYELAQLWISDDNHSHGFFIPLISGFFAWQWLRTQGWPEEGEPARGAVWLALGCLLHLAAVVVWLPPVDWLALSAMLYGLVVVIGGREWARGFRFSILFLFFMFPLPASLTERGGVWLQGMVTELAATVLQFFLPVYREGHFLLLPGNEQVEVGEGCSGLRQVVAFAALTMIVIHASQRGWLFKLALLLSALPLAVLANLLRVLLMTVVVRHAGVEWIQGAYHSAWGLATMVGGLLLYLGVMAWLGKVLPVSSDEPATIPSRPPSTMRAWGATGRLGLAVGALAATLLAQYGLQAHLASASFPEPSGLRRPLEDFPRSIGSWTGADSPLPPFHYYDEADDRIFRHYVAKADGGRGSACQVWLVHFRDGRDRLHHPQICHLVAGYTEDPSGRATLRLEGRPAPVERFCFTRGGRRSYVAYWHYTLESPAHPAGSWLQRLHQRQVRRSPSLTIQLFASAGTPEQLQTLTELVRRVDAEIQSHLPPGARMGSETLPIRYTGAPRAGPRNE